MRCSSEKRPPQPLEMNDIVPCGVIPIKNFTVLGCGTWTGPIHIEYINPLPKVPWNSWLMNPKAICQPNLDMQLHEHSFRDNQTKVRFYTGLPSFATLMVLFEFVAPYVPSTRCILPMFQQFLMVLMKLRLNLWEPSETYIGKMQRVLGTYGAYGTFRMTKYRWNIRWW